MKFRVIAGSAGQLSTESEGKRQPTRFRVENLPLELASGITKERRQFHGATLRARWVVTLELRVVPGDAAFIPQNSDAIIILVDSIF